MHITRDCYRQIKKMSKTQLEEFIERQRFEAYNQCLETVSMSITKRLADGIKRTPGIDEETYQKIMENVVGEITGYNEAAESETK